MGMFSEINELRGRTDHVGYLMGYVRRHTSHHTAVEDRAILQHLQNFSVGEAAYEKFYAQCDEEFAHKTYREVDAIIAEWLRSSRANLRGGR